MTAKKGGLGRNLNVLLSNSGLKVKPQSSAKEQGVRKLTTDRLQTGQFQPRRSMDDEALSELAASIKKQGILQPIIVRQLADERFEIIAGERRWRAAQLAGLSEVPVIVHDMDDETAMAVALIENIQREDLNPMEEAIALARLVDEFSLTHEQIGKLVGKSRASVSNLLRLMNLNQDVKRMLEYGDLEMGHARAILALPSNQQSEIARQVVSRDLSVRDTEHLVRKSLQPRHQDATQKDAAISEKINQAERAISHKTGRKIQIKHGVKGNGRVVLHYQNLDELEQLIRKMEKGLV